MWLVLTRCTQIQVMVVQQKVGADVESASSSLDVCGERTMTHIFLYLTCDALFLCGAEQSKQMVNAAMALMWQYLNAEDDLVYVLHFISSRTVSVEDQAMGKQRTDVWFSLAR